jgi:epoxyqueuosine reductase QueG
LDKRSIQREIARFVRNYSEQTSAETRWKKPLVAFASAEDPLFLKLKEWVRPSHALPRDLLPTAKTVIAYFLPFEKRIQKENAREESYSSRSWAVAYIETNRLIQDLNEHLKQFLKKAGYQMVHTPATHNFDPAVLLSDWSHRHIAYIAGLGRLGLNNWLITEKGCCGRLGTFITEASFSPTPRPEQEVCLQKAGYRCLVCMERCTYRALFSNHFDRHACYRQLLKNDTRFSDLGTADVCGKCGCGLPCSASNPVALRKDRKGSGEELAR